MPLTRLTEQSLKGGNARDVLVDLHQHTIRDLQDEVSDLYGLRSRDVKLVYKAKPLINGRARWWRSGSGRRPQCTWCIARWCLPRHGGAAEAGQGCAQNAPGTPFQGRQLFLTITCPDSYPLRPPKVTFQHPLYHPNVYDGSNRLCWSDDDDTGSTYSLEGIIGIVNTLLATPNPSSPANRAAAKLYASDKEGWVQEARERAADVLFRL